MIWAILLGVWLLWCIVIGFRSGLRRDAYWRHHRPGTDIHIEVNVGCDQSDHRDQSDNHYHEGR